VIEEFYTWEMRKQFYINQSGVEKAFVKSVLSFSAHCIL
jgi:hypothetical protein